MKIVDFARTMITLAGLRPDRDIRIEHTGLRPGKKLFEELFDEAEITIPTCVDGVFVASARFGVREAAVAIVDVLETAACVSDPDEICIQWSRIVPELPISEFAGEGRSMSLEQPVALRLQAVVIRCRRRMAALGLSR